MKTFTADTIKKDLTTQGYCNIPGIGKLKVIDKAERQSRNPRTGESITVPARKVVKFSQSSVLKDALNA